MEFKEENEIDGIRDACGIIGIYDKNNLDTAHLAYFGLMALQHRGQESAGIAINNDGYIACYKELGLVQEVFNDNIIGILKGDMCLGHVRYSNNRDNIAINAQPFVAKYKKGIMAVSINGALTNADQLREKLQESGTIFTTNTDCEIIAALIAKKFKGDIVESIKKTYKELKGGFAIGILVGDKIIGMRDKYGIRPLSIGKLPNGYAIASESVAFDFIGAEHLCEVKPNEITVIDDSGLNFVSTDEEHKKSLCAFEYVYFARPDSNMNDISIYKTREEFGRQLAKEFPVEADCIIGVPDSGTPAAIGYSSESGIPYCIGLVKNRYIGRSFIKPTQEQRELAVKLKLNPMKDVVDGKRVVLIDDSIVRGTTSMQIIELLKDAGAAEVHVRISCPEVVDICPFGIDIPNKADLISTQHSAAEVCKMIGADSLGFLSVDGLTKALDMQLDENTPCGQYCMGCTKGKWPGINI